MKIGIAISVYDKWEELKILVDIIRSWDGDYEILICSNHPDAKKHLIDIDFDTFVPARDIPFTTKTCDSKGEATFFLDQAENYYIRLRACDCVQTACKAITRFTACDYCIHVHTDAWFLSEEGLNFFISTLSWTGKKIAVRGTGLGDIYRPWTSCSAFGQADDHFFAWNRQWAENNGLWDYKPEDMLMRKYSVHGTLMNVFAVRGGLGNVWYYRELKDCLNCYGKKTKDNEVKPCIYDPVYGFLHIHRGSLPGDWGKKLQAWYLVKYAKRYCPSVRGITSYYDEDIINKIKERNNQLNKKLKWRLYPKKIINKERITYKQFLLDHFTLSTLLKNMKQRAYKLISSKVFKDVDVHEQYKELNKGLHSWVD